MLDINNYTFAAWTASLTLGRADGAVLVGDLSAARAAIERAEWDVIVERVNNARPIARHPSRDQLELEDMCREIEQAEENGHEDEAARLNAEANRLDTQISARRQARLSARSQPRPQTAAPRRCGHRVSRVARRAARKAATSSSGGSDDGEPPEPPHPPPIGTRCCIEVPGCGAIIAYEFAGYLVVEASAISDLGDSRELVEQRKQILNAIAAKLFGPGAVAEAERRARCAS